MATGNGPYNGKTDWGDSVIELDADATPVLANYSPADDATLNIGDLDLGSLPPYYSARMPWRRAAIRADPAPRHRLHRRHQTRAVFDRYTIVSETGSEGRRAEAGKSTLGGKGTPPHKGTPEAAENGTPEPRHTRGTHDSKMGVH